jgi:hypothetical protein
MSEDELKQRSSKRFAKLLTKLLLIGDSNIRLNLYFFIIVFLTKEETMKKNSR